MVHTIITDKKPYDRIHIKWKRVLKNDEKLQANGYDKTQIKQRCVKDDCTLNFLLF